MRRCSSKICKREYWLVESGEEFAHQGLPVFTKSDVELISKSIQILGREGLNTVFNRRMKGRTVQQCIDEWILFKSQPKEQESPFSKPSAARDEFFALVEKMKSQKNHIAS